MHGDFFWLLYKSVRINQVLAASQSVARTAAQLLRQGRPPPGSAAVHQGVCLPLHQHKQYHLCQELGQHLSKLEQARLLLRRDWLQIRVNLHNRLHGNAALMSQQAGPLKVNIEDGGSRVGLLNRGVPAADRFWPTDSIHFFTFSYGASRVLNKLSGVAQAALDAWAAVPGSTA
eukprot:gene5898-6138_t